MLICTFVVFKSIKHIFSRRGSNICRYTSYRTVPDGRTADKPSSRSQYDSRSLSPERPSALGPPKRDYYSGSQSLDRPKSSDRLAGEDLSRGKPRERSRTHSAELDFRSAPLSAYSELSKTMPALSGRSRGKMAFLGVVCLLLGIFDGRTVWVQHG